MNTTGISTNAVAGVAWMAEELSPYLHDHSVQEALSELLGDSLTTLEETFGDNLGELLGRI